MDCCDELSGLLLGDAVELGWHVGFDGVFQLNGAVVPREGDIGVKPGFQIAACLDLEARLGSIDESVAEGDPELARG